MATYQPPASPRSASTLCLNGREFLDFILYPSLPGTGWLADLRNQARARIDELGIPTTRDEDWKYTDLSELIQHRFHPVAEIPALEELRSQMQTLTWPEARHSRLVFVNGIYVPDFSDTSALPESLTIAPLSDVACEQVQSYLQSIAGDDVFVTLNTACLQQAAAIVVPRSTQIEVPIHVLCIASPDPQTPRIAQPRVLLVAGSSCAATLIEDHISLGEDLHFTNGVSEIWLEANARLTHIRQQREGSQTYHIAKTAIHQARDSQYSHHGISLGGRLSRHTLELAQTGESATTLLNGLALAAAHQLADTHTTIDHQHPHGSSRQLHKLILRDSAHGVFNGKLLVRRAAQLTDASQSSRNLLISPKARVDTKPQLEIFADNVKCAHGATVSQLEEDEVFYLQSRGIDVNQACALLTYGFAAEVIERIPLASLRDRCRQEILNFIGVR